VKFIFLGIIQGLTEFLPISSSGHLYILERYLDLRQNPLPFFVLLHFATFLAICIFLRKEIISVLTRKNVLIHIGIISVITAVLGLAINYFLSSFFESRYWVPFFLFINGGVLLSTRNVSQNRDSQSINLRDSLVLGVLQGLAVFPGISRSGITVVSLLRQGFKAKEAFSLSFLMAMPVFFGVFLVKLKELANSNMALADMAGGFIAAFFCGLLALAVVKRILIRQKFDKFGYYCIAIAFLSLILGK